MQQSSCVQAETAAIPDARGRERQILTRSIDLLTKASAAGAGSGQEAEAIDFLERVWTSFLEDLGSFGKAFPSEIRGNLISIGLWLLREAGEVRCGRSDNLEGLIEISQIVRDGIP